MAIGDDAENDTQCFFESDVFSENEAIRACLVVQLNSRKLKINENHDRDDSKSDFKI